MKMIFIIKNTTIVSASDMYPAVYEYLSDPIDLVDNPIHDDNLDTVIEAKYCFMKNFKHQDAMRISIDEEGKAFINDPVNKHSRYFMIEDWIKAADTHGTVHLVSKRSSAHILDGVCLTPKITFPVATLLCTLKKIGDTSCYILILNPDWLISEGHPIISIRINEEDIYICRGLNHTANTNGIDMETGRTEGQSFFNIEISGIKFKLDSYIVAERDISIRFTKNVETRIISAMEVMTWDDVIIETNATYKIKGDTLIISPKNISYVKISIKGDDLELFTRSYVISPYKG